MLDESVAGRRFNAILVMAFAVAALVLAAGGIYGLLVYSVAQQDREIGIRRALGASATAILKAVGGRALAAAGIGALVGIALSMAVSRAIAGLLFGIAPFDALSYAVAVSVLGVVVLAAAAVPFRRALHVDPAVSLRAE
jgi:ABC-type antimicrobial peptide transport system permease subunit